MWCLTPDSGSGVSSKYEPLSLCLFKNSRETGNPVSLRLHGRTVSTLRRKTILKSKFEIRRLWHHNKPAPVLVMTVGLCFIERNPPRGEKCNPIPLKRWTGCEAARVGPPFHNYCRITLFKNHSSWEKVLSPPYTILQLLLRVQVTSHTDSCLCVYADYSQRTGKCQSRLWAVATAATVLRK